jgi:hypothetical protein
MYESEIHKDRRNAGGLNGALVVAAVDYSMYKYLPLKYEDQYSVKLGSSTGFKPRILPLSLSVTI